MHMRSNLLALGLAIAASFGASVTAPVALAAEPLRLDPRAAQAMPLGSDAATTRAEGKALVTKLAPLYADPRFAPLKAEFETAAAIRDAAQRKAALRAVVDKAAPLRTLPSVVTAGKLSAPVRITELSPAIAHALGDGSVSIHPSTFDQQQGTKNECGDSSDAFSFPGGDPYVTAISTPAPGDSDCLMVGATKSGGKVTAPAGTKRVDVTAQLDYTLNADTYGVGAWARAYSKLVMVAMSTSVRFANGVQVPGLSIAECQIAAIGGTSSTIFYEERQAKEQNRRVGCTFGIESGSGEVSLGFAVRAGIDADMTAVAQADGRLDKIRGVQAAFTR
jgi:hypothetical protein